MVYKIKKKKERLTNKRLNFLIEDEKKASAEYKKYGFTELSNDEKRHRKFLQALKKKREKKKFEEDDGGMSIVDDVYDMGEDVVQRANPFTMAGKSLGYDDEKQKKINKQINGGKKK